MLPQQLKAGMCLRQMDIMGAFPLPCGIIHPLQSCPQLQSIAPEILGNRPHLGIFLKGPAQLLQRAMTMETSALQDFPKPALVLHTSSF